MDDIETKLGCGCVVLFVLLVVIYNIVYVASADVITGTITKTVVDDGDTYFVIHEDGKTETEIFQNEDSFLFWKFNSNDVLMNLEPNNRYSFKVAGWRVRFLSMYRNIINFQALPTTE